MNTFAGPLSSMTGLALRNAIVWSPNVNVLDVATVAAVALVGAVGELVVEADVTVVAVGEATADRAERAEKEPQRKPAWHPGRPSLSVQRRYAAAVQGMVSCGLYI